MSDAPAEIELLLATPGQGLPYPASTDPVSQGAAAIQALAQAVDPKLSAGQELIYAQKTTDVVVTTALTMVVQTATIAFPACTGYLEFYAVGYSTNQTAAFATCYLGLDGNGTRIELPLANNQIAYGPVSIRQKLTLAAGNHYFDFQGACSNGTMTVRGGAGPGGGLLCPIFIRFVTI